MSNKGSVPSSRQRLSILLHKSGSTFGERDMVFAHGMEGSLGVWRGDGVFENLLKFLHDVLTDRGRVDDG